MKNISILVPAGNAAFGCIEGAYTIFNKANEFLVKSNRVSVFNVHIVGLTRHAQGYGKFTIHPDLQIHDSIKSDLVIIPAVNGDLKKVISLNKDFLPWIVTQYKEGSEVASLCVGAFLLGATGLLKKKKCATHWQALNEFRKMFPDTELMPEKIFAGDTGIYSSAGGNSFWNLLLYLIEKYTYRELAIQCAKYFEIDLNRNSQSAFRIFIAPKDHQDDSIKKVQIFIEENFNSRITVDQLSDMIGIEKRTFERRFKKATYLTISEYIQQVKMEAVKTNLETGRKNIDETMKEAGYADMKAFRTIFKKTTGLSPTEYKNKYSIEVGR